jgi:hypothetical protein
MIVYETLIDPDIGKPISYRNNLNPSINGEPALSIVIFTNFYPTS